MREKGYGDLFRETRKVAQGVEEDKVAAAMAENVASGANLIDLREKLVKGSLKGRRKLTRDSSEEARERQAA